MADHVIDLPTEARVHAPHVVPVRVLLTSWLVLLILTTITVAVSRYDLGRVNLAVALGIASAKAALVALFFMHLKYENRFHLVVLVSSVLFAALFTIFVVFDTTQYQPSIRQRAADVKLESSHADHPGH